MKKYICAAALTATVTAAFLSACKPAESAQSEARILKATHAFDTSALIKAAAFSPNDVASWLGAVAMVSEDGDLLVTNIEGKRPKALSGGPYSDVIGTTRTGEPALFLALTQAGDIRAFIEADNDGNFKAIPISGNTDKLAVICKRPAGVTDRLDAITADGKVISLSVKLADSAALRKSSQLGAAKNASHCVSSGETVYALSGTKLFKVGSADIKINRDASGLALINSGEGNVLAVSHISGAPVTFYNADDLSPAGAFNIGPGLSIAGLSGARGVFATSAPFGGAAFNSGVLAFTDNDEDRIVILSQSYITGELSGADAR